MPMPMNRQHQGPEFLRDPYPAYAALRDAAPLQRLPGERGGFLVTGDAEAREAFTDPRLSKDTGRPGGPP
ncbi:hypothetical protein [Kitasatospora viridis]